MDVIFDAIDEILPHGSGFNFNYEYSFTTNSRLKAHSYYHCMDDAGGYIGVAGFTVTFNLKAGTWRLSFDNDNRTRYLTIKHDLRTYITDTLVRTLEGGLL